MGSIDTSELHFPQTGHAKHGTHICQAGCLETGQIHLPDPGFAEHAADICDFGKIETADIYFMQFPAPAEHGSHGSHTGSIKTGQIHFRKKAVAVKKPVHVQSFRCIQMRGIHSDQTVFHGSIRIIGKHIPAVRRKGHSFFKGQGCDCSTPHFGAQIDPGIEAAVHPGRTGDGDILPASLIGLKRDAVLSRFVGIGGKPGTGLLLSGRCRHGPGFQDTRFLFLICRTFSFLGVRRTLSRRVFFGSLFFRQSLCRDGTGAFCLPCFVIGREDLLLSFVSSIFLPAAFRRRSRKTHAEGKNKRKQNCRPSSVSFFH